MLLVPVVSAIFVFIIAAVIIFLFDGFFGKLDFSTSKKSANEVIALLKQRGLQNGNFIDLGSDKGGLAFKIGKALPGIKALGIDDNVLRVVIAKMRGAFLKNIVFKKGDIFKTNVSLADAVYIYLPIELMPALETKLKEELKPGAVVFTNRVSFPNWQATEKINDIFIYAKE